jgi:hypothetical protein
LASAPSSSRAPTDSGCAIYFRKTPLSPAGFFVFRNSGLIH